MAEIFGAVASGAGLMSLAIQLLETAQKLRKIQGSFRAALAKLGQIAFDIEMMSLALRQIEADRMQHDVSDHDLLSRCLQNCRQGTEKIVTTTDKFQRMLLRSKTAGRIVIAFKEPELDAMFVELEQAKTTLHLAWSIYSESVQRHNDRRQQQAMLDMQATLTAVLAQSKMPDQTHGADVSSSDSTSGAPERTTRGKGQSGGRIYHARMFLPRWITDRIWHFGFTAAEDGWMLNFSTTRHVPRNAEIFEACEDGDLERVQLLFADGKASIYDEHNTRTPLLCAVGSGNLSLCRFLLNAGRRCDQSTALLRASDDLYDDYDGRTEVIELNELIDEALGREGFLLAPEVFSFTDSLFTLRVELPQIMPRSRNQLEKFSHLAFGQWPLPSRLGAAHFFSDVECPDDLRRTVGLVTEASLRMACEVYGNELLVAAVNHFSKTSDETSASKWIRFVQYLESMGAKIDSSYAASAFHFLMTKSQARSGSCASMLQVWLSQLLEANVDLLDFGRQELARWENFEQQQAPKQLQYVTVRWQEAWKLRFRFGTLPSDWALIQNDHFRQIWTLEATPGAWPDERLSVRTIFWRPRETERAEGSWHLSRYRTAVNQDFLQDCFPKRAKPPATALGVLRTFAQDDASLGPVLFARRDGRNGRRRRSASQPPSSTFLDARESISGLSEKGTTGWEFHYCLDSSKLAFGTGFDVWTLRRDATDNCYDHCHWHKGFAGQKIETNMRRARVRWKQENAGRT